MVPAIHIRRLDYYSFGSEGLGYFSRTFNDRWLPWAMFKQCPGKTDRWTCSYLETRRPVGVPVLITWLQHSGNYAQLCDSAKSMPS
jgi:hypothetical protein